MLSSYQYGSVVVLALHCLYFVFLAAKRPYRSRVMTVRNLINEGAILVVLAIVVYYVFAGKSDDLTAELAIWVVIASLLMNIGMLGYAAYARFSPQKALTKEDNEVTAENLGKDSRSAEAIDSNINPSKAKRAVADYSQLELSSSGRVSTRKLVNKSQA